MKTSKISLSYSVLVGLRALQEAMERLLEKKLILDIVDIQFSEENVTEKTLWFDCVFSYTEGVGTTEPEKVCCILYKDKYGWRPKEVLIVCPLAVYRFEWKVAETRKSEIANQQEIHLSPKSQWQKDDCLWCSQDSTIEAVFNNARVRCCVNGKCKIRSAKLAYSFPNP